MKIQLQIQELTKCNECDQPISGRPKESFMVDGRFCSERCKDLAERISA